VVEQELHQLYNNLDAINLEQQNLGNVNPEL